MNMTIVMHRVSQKSTDTAVIFVNILCFLLCRCPSETCNMTAMFVPATRIVGEYGPLHCLTATQIVAFWPVAKVCGIEKLCSVVLTCGA